MKAKENNITGSQKVESRLTDFLQRNQKMIIVVAVAIVVVIIAVCIAVSVMQGNADKKFDALADLEAQRASFYSLDAESDEYASAYADFSASADELIASSGLDSYPGAKAELLLGDIAFDAQDYQTAADSYASVAAVQGDTYLGQLAMMNEAACYENLGDQTLALELYNEVFDTYGEGSPYAPKALFNAGRLYQELGDTELAKATFEQLTGLYLAPENGGQPSEYAKMAEAYLVTMN